MDEQVKVDNNISLNIRLKTKSDINKVLRPFNEVITASTAATILKKSVDRQFCESDIRRFLGGGFISQSTDYSLWKEVKKINRSVTKEPPLKLAIGNEVKNNGNKARELAAPLEEVYVLTEPRNSKCPFNLTSSHLRISLKEIRSLFMKKRSWVWSVLACWNSCLKSLETVVLLNAILAVGHYPNFWKNILVVRIPKSEGDATQLKSDRPQSLLLTISKAFKKRLLQKLL